MFLDHLIARAEGTAPVLKSAPKLARELEDPAWSPTPETDPAEFEAAASLPSAPTRSRPEKSVRQPITAEPAPESVPGPATPPRPAPAAAIPASLQATASTQPEPARGTSPTPETPQRRPATPLPPQAEPRPVIAPRPTAPVAAAPAATPLQTPPSPALQISPEIIAALAPPPVSAAQLQRPDAPPDPVAPGTGPDERIEVQVEIGQLDLVSPPPPTRPAPHPASRAARPGPNLSLTDYLDRGRGNRR